MTRRSEWALIGLILVTYLLLAGLYAVRTPDWQAPDEPAHYNYVRQLADEGELPVLERGDWQQGYQDELTASGFDPARLDRLDTVEYEDHQPPLYYLLQAPVYALTDGDLLALRLVSALIGAGAVLAAWGVLRVLAPRWPVLALAGAGFVAFLPQRLAIMGSVSNDALAETVAGAGLLAAVLYLRGRNETGARLHPARLGLLAGIALITKTTIYFMAGIMVLTVLLRWRRERWPRRTLIRQMAWVVVPALMLGGLWWARGLDVYGGTDFLGLERHEAVTVGQLRTQDYINNYCSGSTRCYLENYAETTFHSFWGQFGWMALPMPVTVYRLLLLFTLAVIAGVGLFAWRTGGLRALSGPGRDGLVVLGAALTLVAAAYLFYNREFVQFQGRYLYPALVPLAGIVAAGLTGWTLPLADRVPALRWLPLVVMAGLAAFALYTLEAYLVPSLPAW